MMQSISEIESDAFLSLSLSDDQLRSKSVCDSMDRRTMYMNGQEVIVQEKSTVGISVKAI